MSSHESQTLCAASIEGTATRSAYTGGSVLVLELDVFVPVVYLHRTFVAGTAAALRACRPVPLVGICMPL